MQVCGSQHPDHYKRSLDARDDGVATATTADTVGDLNACLSVYSKLIGQSTNVSLATWEMFALTDLTIRKPSYMNLNVTEELAGWIAKFQKWDSNRDGVLT
jgi:hypothetical protein